MRNLMIIALGCWGFVLPACDSNSPGSGGNASDSFTPSGPTNDTQTAPDNTQSPPAGADQVPNDTQTAPNDTQHTPWNSPGNTGAVTVVVSGAGGTSSTTTQTTGGSTSATTQSSCSTTNDCIDCTAGSCAECNCEVQLGNITANYCVAPYCN